MVRAAPKAVAKLLLSELSAAGIVGYQMIFPERRAETPARQAFAVCELRPHDLNGEQLLRTYRVIAELEKTGGDFEVRE